jgi:hypothetical protein
MRPTATKTKKKRFIGWSTLSSQKSRARSKAKYKTKSKTKPLRPPSVPGQPNMRRTTSGKHIIHKSWIRSRECKKLEKCQNRYRAALYGNYKNRLERMVKKYNINLDTSDEKCIKLLNDCIKDVKFINALNSIKTEDISPQDYMRLSTKLKVPTKWFKKYKRARKKTRKRVRFTK